MVFKMASDAQFLATLLQVRVFDGGIALQSMICLNDFSFVRRETQVARYLVYLPPN